MHETSYPVRLQRRGSQQAGHQEQQAIMNSANGPPRTIRIISGFRLEYRLLHISVGAPFVKAGVPQHAVDSDDGRYKDHLQVVKGLHPHWLDRHRWTLRSPAAMQIVPRGPDQGRKARSSRNLPGWGVYDRSQYLT